MPATVYATTGYDNCVSNWAQLTLKNDNIFGDDDAVPQLGDYADFALSLANATVPTPHHLRRAQ